MKVQCCKCKRMNVEGRWEYPARHIHELVSHGYCPACADATKLEFFCQQASRATHGRAGQLNDLLRQSTT